MKRVKMLVSIILTLVLIFSFTGQGFAAGNFKVTRTEDGRTQISMEFKDSKEAEWALEYIAKMQSKDIFKGYEDGTFRPNQPVKRVEAIVTAVRLMGLEEEAKAKPKHIKLYFNDAKLLDEKYSWAKGYVIVALENGLFDTSEYKLQPDKPASRVWVASLLVRALGLQGEALTQMTSELDFKDARTISAGAIGYVKVAADYGLITGYTDETFQPNKNVTRAEMAAMLDRTSDQILEESGAVKITGTIKDIGFDDQGSATSDVYGEEIDEDNVMDGNVTIETFYGDVYSYFISSELLVQYNKRFITADQLLVDDVVSLYVKDNIVKEAALLEEEAIVANTVGIYQFKVDIDFGNKEKYKLTFRNNNGKVKAEIEHRKYKKKDKIKGKEAANAVEKIILEIDLSPEMSKEVIIQKVLNALHFDEKQFEKLKIEIKFSNGKKVNIEIENEEYEEIDDDIALEDNDDNEVDINEDINEEFLRSIGIKEFKLILDFTDEEESYWKYEYNDGDIDAEVKLDSEVFKGFAAIGIVKDLLERLDLNTDMDDEEVLETIYNVLDIDDDVIKNLALSLEFMDDEE